MRLLHRTTREVSLTSDGHDLAERCRRIVDEIDALRGEAEGARGEPTGTLRLSAPITFGKRVLVPLLPTLTARHARLGLDLALTDRFVDLVKEGFDAAVRVGALRDSTLVARTFATQQPVVCASPAYVARYGRPASPDDLAKHRCLAFRQPTSGRPRPWEFGQGRTARVRTPVASATMNDGEAMVAAAICGMGLLQVPDYMAEDALRARSLVEVLKAYRPPSLPISLVYAGTRLVTPGLRVLLEALTGRASLHRKGV